MNRRALITGAAGFVGHYLKVCLLDRGWDVVTSDMRASDVLCDFSKPDDVLRLMAEAGDVSHVFHLAARTFVPDAMRNPWPTFEVNLNGTMLLEQALRTRQPKARLLFISSGEVYGPPLELPMTEDHPLNPGNPYAISKTAADHYCAYGFKAHGADILRIRPFNHSGAGQADNFVLSSFARQVAEAEAGLRDPVLKVGNLDAARDFSHVRDVVRAYEALAREGEAGEAYNVCSGTSVVVRDALDFLIAESNVAVTVELDPARVRPVDVPEVRGSHAKLTQRTGWTPEIPIEQTLRELLEHWRAACHAHS